MLPALRIAWYAIVAGVFCTSAPDRAALALRAFTGAQIIAHGITLRLGDETFRAAGSPDPSAGWLGAWLSIRFGALVPDTLTVVVECCAVLALLGCVEWRARCYGATPPAALAAAVLVTLLSADALHTGSGLAAFLGAAAIGALLARPQRFTPLAVGAVAVVWVNVSGSGLLAPVVALLCSVAPAYRRRTALASVALAALAVLLTPAGPLLMEHAGNVLRLDRGVGALAILWPDVSAPRAYRIGLPVLLIAALAAVRFPRVRRGDALGLFAGLLLAFADGAYLPLLGIICTPGIVARLTAGTGEPQLPVLRRAIAAAFAAACVLLALERSGAVPPDGGAAAAAAAVVERLDGSRPQRVFCVDIAWCDFALGRPAAARVFMDDRLGAYPDAVRDDAVAIRYTRGDWRRRLVADGIDTIVARTNDQLVTLVLLDPSWHVRARSGDALLVARDSAAP